MSLTGTPLQTVYDSFLASVTADDWMLEEDIEIIERDWEHLLLKAIDRFERPQISLTLDENREFFVESLSAQEINLLARYMKLEWLNRCIADWRQIKQLYSNKD